MLMGLAPFNLPLDTRESARNDPRLHSFHLITGRSKQPSAGQRLDGSARSERNSADPGGESLPENWFLPLGCCGSIRDG